MLHEIVERVRREIPGTVPLFVRLSASDWIPGGLQPADVAAAAQGLADLGVDLIDVFCGVLSPRQHILTGSGYQVGFARLIREATGTPVAAVRELTGADQANGVFESGSADAVFIGRALLRNPHWPQWAAQQLLVETYTPKQHSRAW